MALTLKKAAGSLPYSLMQYYMGGCVPFRGVFIKGVPMYTDSKINENKGTNSSEESKQSIDSQDKKEKKINGDVFSANLRVVRRSPKPPSPGEGSGPKIN